MRTAPLTSDSPWLAEIARSHFAYWGPLTGQSSCEAYEAYLHEAVRSADLPRILVATESDELLGSVTVMRSEMTIRPNLTPWMGRLFVTPGARGRRVGEMLADEAGLHAAALGFGHLYLFTSGTLPTYYRARGWDDLERVEYLGKLRTVMRRALGRDVAASGVALGS